MKIELGEHVMRGLVASIVCAVSCLGTTAATAQSALANHPIVGAWTLNVARSQGANVRLVVSSSAPGQIDMQMMGLSARFRVDGTPYPTFGGMASWKQVSPRAWDAEVKDQGTVASVDHYVLSADEQNLTITSETPGRTNGAAERLMLRRASGGPGLVGVWQGRRAVGDATAEYAVENGQLRIHLSPSEERFLGRLDGKDYPWSIPGTEAGRITAAGRVVDSRTISIVLKEKGVPFHYATLAVTADGRTLQIDQVHGAKADAPERSRLIYERR